MKQTRQEVVTLLCVVAAFVFWFNHHGTVVGISEEVEMLLQFKSGIQRDPLGYISQSWKESSMAVDGCPVSWYGISCSNGHISGIELSSLGLAGQGKLDILSKLKMLQFLNLFNNSLTGELPAQLGHLQSIRNLDLSDNLFLGSMPKEINGMQSLQNLSLSGNRMVGNIPPSIGRMSSLQHLDLSRNSLSGQLPTSFASLQHLLFLNLSSNMLTGHLPAGLGTLINLKSLDLHSNKLSGSVGRTLMDLSGVQHIDFSCNKFDGLIPWKMLAISSLTQSLRYLNLSNNMFTGSLVTGDTIPLFGDLKVLDMSHNYLTGPLPAFHFMYSLEVLRLANNRFKGFIPFTLLARDESVLMELDLSCNNLSGPVGLVSSTTLKILNLSSNSLSGPLPFSMGSCAILDLSYNRFSGNLSVMKTWGDDLEVIDLSCNRFTGTLPNDTSQFLRLRTLNLSGNGFSGSLPSVLGTYPKLNQLDLSFNNLMGKLLSSFFTSSTLAYLCLSNNKFSGGIPLSKMIPSSPASSFLVSPLTPYSSLEILRISSNQLEGGIPKEIGLLNDLKVLDLSSNRFVGGIPCEIDKLDMLLYLNLSSNHLSGRIPNNCIPRNLNKLDLSFNDLSGIVPSTLMRFNESSFHPGNPKLIYPHASHNTTTSIVNTNSPANSHSKGLNSTAKAALIGGCSAAALLIIIIALFLLLLMKVFKGKEEVAKHAQSGGQFSVTDPRRESYAHVRHACDTNKYMSGSSSSSSSKPPVAVTFSGDDVVPSVKDPHFMAFKSFSSDPTLHWGPASGIKDVHTRNLSASSAAVVSNKKNRFRWPSPGSAYSSTPEQQQQQQQHVPVILKVCSPDRLVGDLCFLDDYLSSSVTAEELSRAPAEILGRSSHGTTYKATLDNGHLLTVKWLREGLPKKKRRDFVKELKKLGDVKHPNIISVRGYYWGPNHHERLVLYDYVTSGSLASHLYEKKCIKSPALSWNQRQKIAIDIARGMVYLHQEKGFPHGNLKATNVLLEGPELNAKLTDYGLHRLITDAAISEQVLSSGVLGYLAPELIAAKRPKPSFKADIYAFGMLLLEILTGKSASDMISGNTGVVIDLAEWVKQLVSEGRTLQVLDPTMLVGVEDECLKGSSHESLLTVALECILPLPDRPIIKSVYEKLTSLPN